MGMTMKLVTAARWSNFSDQSPATTPTKAMMIEAIRLK